MTACPQCGLQATGGFRCVMCGFDRTTWHQPTVTETPITFLIRCRCGWSDSVRRQNALARAAKIRGAITAHRRKMGAIDPDPRWRPPEG